MVCILLNAFDGHCIENMTVFVVRGRLCLCWPSAIAI